MLNCQEATRLYSEAQERELSPKENMSLKMHVMVCSGCRNFGKHMYAIRQAMRAFARGEDQRFEQSDK